MHIALIVLGVPLLLAAALSGVVGYEEGPWILRPARRPLSQELIAGAGGAFGAVGGSLDDFDVRAADAAILRGWLGRPSSANGDWVLLFHGIGDNRAGMVSYASFLLRKGYGVVLMDSRAQGESDGNLATFGWKERYDVRAILDALIARVHPRHIFLLGESMGASIALQAAAVDDRIDGVVAEAPFSNLREVAYDYAGLHWNPWLGKTLFRPAVIFAIRAVEREGDFRADNVSPEEAVAARSFPILLICGGADHTVPCRHALRIFAAASGAKQLWVVAGAGHTQAYGADPAEFERRVLGFFGEIGASERAPAQ
ncbi:MAG: alpha/beta fold hydrolase [Candidatus Acidiferrales bacterium]